MQAKLQAKEQESLHLQQQVQDLQAQLLNVQVNWMSPVLKQQLKHFQQQCQALQMENEEIRTVAMFCLDENARLQAVSTESLQNSEFFKDPHQHSQGCMALKAQNGIYCRLFLQFQIMFGFLIFSAICTMII